MTPKEKALELVDKFEHAKKYANSSNAMSRELAKECALVAVDEILVGYMGNPKVKYWTEVKRETELL